MLGIAILATLVIWLVCNIIDYARICIFKVFRIYKFTSWLGVKLECLINIIIKNK